MKIFQGSYGIDFLSLLLILLSLILNLFDITRFLGLIILIYALYRCFSKKIYKRKQEYNLFYTYINKFLSKFDKSLPYNLPVYDLNNISKLSNSIKSKYKEFVNYKIVKCPNCSQKLRLPRHKGKIVVTCKKCTHKFDLKT